MARPFVFSFSALVAAAPSKPPTLWLAPTGWDVALQQDGAPSAEQNFTRVLVLGGMMNPNDLAVAVSLAADASFRLQLYNNRAEERCESTTEPGHWCGLACAELELPADAACTDVPNMGRGEAAYFRYVVEHYEALGDASVQIVFAGSTVTGEGREPQLRELLADVAAETPPACWVHPTGLTDAEMLRFSLTGPCQADDEGSSEDLEHDVAARLRATFGNPRDCAAEWGRKATCYRMQVASGQVVNGTTFEAGATPCDISYIDQGRERPQTVCMAEPNSLELWMNATAPAPGVARTEAPCCGRGLFRTSGAAIRRRAKAEYEDVLRQLLRCSNPEEVAGFVERMALYLFASL